MRIIEDTQDGPSVDSAVESEATLHALIYANIWDAVSAMERWSSSMNKWHGRVINDMNGWLQKNGEMLVAREGGRGAAAAAPSESIRQGVRHQPGNSSSSGPTASATWAPIPMVRDVDQMLAKGANTQVHGISDPWLRSLLDPSAVAGAAWGGGFAKQNEGGKVMGVVHVQVKSRAALPPPASTSWPVLSSRSADPSCSSSLRE
jgi:hypothetical protein